MRNLKIESVEQTDKSASGLIPALARVLASVAARDGVVTTSEYARLVEAANRLADGAHDPSLPTAIFMRTLSSPEDIDKSLKGVKDAAKGVDHDTKRAVLDVAVPLLRLQGDDGLELLERLAKAMNVPADAASLGIAPPIRTRSMLGRATSAVGKLLRRKEDERLLSMLAVAQAHDHASLVKAIRERIASDSVDIAEIMSMCAELALQIQHDVEELLKQRQALAERRELVEVTHQATLDNVHQVGKRLTMLQRRVELQKRTFREDVMAFVEDATNEIDLVMRDRMRADDWLDKDVWENFAKTQHGRAVQFRYMKLQQRYEAQVDVLTEELVLFREELVSTRAAFLKTIDHKQFGRLVPPPSLGARFFGAADTLATQTLVTTALATAGGAAAIAAGALSIAALAPIAAPLGVVIFGPMAVAGLYKWVANPEKRKARELKEKRRIIEAGLERMMTETIAAHDKVLDGIVEEFFVAAEQCLTPLVHAAQRTLDIAILQDVWIERSVKNTRDSLKVLETVA